MPEEINHDRRRFLGAAAMTIVGLQLGMIGLADAKPSSELGSIGNVKEWLNSQPLTPTELRGKVVLINFWTYSCINWRRQLPYVRAWAEKYKDQGLVVIGVHAPEFDFEKNVDNVRWAAKDMRVGYPIVIDNNHAIWRAFSNQYWPALYFVDAQGRIRHQQFGEGEYEQSEKIIQKLLAVARNNSINNALVSVDARGAEAAADWNDLKSPENYLGYERTENLRLPVGPNRTSIAAMLSPHD
jgi:thiol-disulfide isomerase/thioredoxin